MEQYHPHYSVLKNHVYPDKELIVIGNGPSLARVPMDFLLSRPTFGVNRITRMWPQFAPTYYCCLGWNQLDTQEKRARINPVLMDERTNLVFLNRAAEHEFPYKKVYTTAGRWMYDLGGKSYDWSAVPLQFVGTGYSNIYPVLQIAYYMGYKKVLLVGLDHFYPDTPQKHFYKDEDEPLFEVGYGPHTPKAWKDGADMVFKIALDHFKNDDRTILNLTDETRCEVFPQDRLENWVD